MLPTMGLDDAATTNDEVKCDFTFGSQSHIEHRDIRRVCGFICRANPTNTTNRTEPYQHHQRKERMAIALSPPRLHQMVANNELGKHETALCFFNGTPTPSKWIDSTWPISMIRKCCLTEPSFQCQKTRHLGETTTCRIPIPRLRRLDF